LYKCYVESDAVFAEINPLVVTPNHQLIALNCNLIIDDNALFRHPDLAGIRADESDTPAEIQARAVGLSYVQLNGQIGCMVNGAGLAMTMMDLIALYGGGEISSAGFLDIGGGASAKKVTQSLRILLTNTNLKAVLINIFGGITKCDEVAQGILEALTEVITDLPIIIRLVGTNADEGRSIINQASLLNLFTAMTLTDAARQVVEAARGKIHGNPG
jgi:succinyl-CoA synthetase beta subunit